ncbi:MAG: hypothetical protein PWP28_2590 [Oceanotoga sp.]|jgi:virginiamycin A acetyltransferase|nr:hypothetical protein [Oceanotoga sp.]
MNEILQSICWWNWSKEKICQKIKYIICGNIDEL